MSFVETKSKFMSKITQVKPFYSKDGFWVNGIKKTDKNVHDVMNKWLRKNKIKLEIPTTYNHCSSEFFDQVILVHYNK